MNGNAYLTLPVKNLSNEKNYLFDQKEFCWYLDKFAFRTSIIVEKSG